MINFLASVLKKISADNVTLSLTTVAPLKHKSIFVILVILHTHTIYIVDQLYICIWPPCILYGQLYIGIIHLKSFISLPTKWKCTYTDVILGCKTIIFTWWVKIYYCTKIHNVATDLSRLKLSMLRILSFEWFFFWFIFSKF